MNESNQVLSELELGERVETAIYEVLQTMTGLEEHLISVHIGDKQSFVGDVTGAMVLNGKISGFFMMIASKETAHYLIPLLTGIEKDELTERDILDEMAEIANIVVGRIKGKLVGTEAHFTLNTPFNIVGSEISLFYNPKNRHICKTFIVNGYDLCFQLIYFD